MPEDVLHQVLLGGRYRLGERIGRGGMADVFRADDLQQGAEVAVKVFRPEVAEAVDPKRIARETRFLTGTQHPTLVSVLDASEPDSPTAYLVMELVPGADLARRLDAGALEPEHVRRIGADVADALALLHSRDLVHRDVKPANILVRDADAAPGPAAKLADLGISVAIDDTRLTATNAVLGTAAYLSPEQVQGRAVGPASDVYALGLVLIESLTGQRAFAGGLIESAMARLNRPPTLPADASPELATLLARMTALDPAARPRAAEVATALTTMRGAMTALALPETAPLARRSMVAEAVTAEFPSPAAPAVRRRRRLRVVPIAAVAAAGLVLMSGAALLPQWQGGQADAIAAPVASSVPRTPTATPSAAASSAAQPAVQAHAAGTVTQAALVARTTSSATTTRSSAASAPAAASALAAATPDRAAPSPTHRKHAAPHAKHVVQHAAHPAHPGSAPHGSKSGPKAPHRH